MVLNKLKTLAIAVSTLLASSQLSAAQGIDPSQDWKVLETDNFRLHYMTEYRDWSIAAAHELEASRDVIEKQQNRILDKKVDVVVFDPLNTSNGFAMPFSSKPFMALYTTPPLSDTQISNSSSWAQLLALHEYVHLVHLAQPTRNEWKQKIREVYDLYDVVYNDVERWAAEGYATLLESKLTSRGRLYDVQVEMMLQQFAREGGWPTYGELSSTEGRYRLGSMAYLIGARFLAWIEQQYSEQMLNAVWVRMEAVKGREFEDAFAGVFNQSAELLYQRYVAEFTQKVLNSENPAAMAESKLWFDGDFELAAPAMSPDQSLLAIVEKSPRGKRQVNLTVYATQDNTKAKEKFEKARTELLEADPADIADVEPEVFKREKKYQLGQTNFSNISNPRWVGNDKLVFGAYSVDADGFLHQDLYQWHLESGQVKRITKEQNVRRFDISADGNTIYAEQNRFGKSAIVKLALDSQLQVSDSEYVMPPSLDAGYDFIRINPQNPQQLMYMKRASNQPWQIVIRDLTSKQESLVPMPAGYQFLSYANWSNDGSGLYFVAGEGEQLKLYHFDLNQSELSVITKGFAPVAWPMELKQGEESELLFLSYRSTGPNLYSRTLDKAQWQTVTKLADQNDYSYIDLISDYPIKMPPAQYNLDSSIGTESDYDSAQGIGRQEITLAVSGSLNTASTSLNEFGIKGSDVLQKVNWLLNFGTDFSEHEGVSAVAQYRGWPIRVSTDFHYYELDFGEQNWDISGLKTKFAGFGVDFDYPYVLGNLAQYQGLIATGFDFNEFKPQSFAIEQTESVYLRHAQSWMLDKQSWGLTQKSDIQLLAGEYDAEVEGAEESYTGYNIDLSLSAHYFGIALTGSYQAAKREDIERRILSAGGAESTLVTASGNPNIVFAPELPFGFARSNDIELMTVSLSRKHSSLNLYYSELLSDGFLRAKIYGLKDEFSLDFVRAGLTNLKVTYGAALVEDTVEEYHPQAWFSLRYQY